MYLNELPLEFNYDFLGVNVGTYEAKHLFYPQTAPINIWLASTVNPYMHWRTHNARARHHNALWTIKWLSSKYMENKSSGLL